MSNAKLKVAKEMYLAGMSDSTIANALGVTVRTIQSWRKQALEKGDNWAALRLAATTSKEDIEQQEKEFLAILISNFERAFAVLQIPPENAVEAALQLELVNKYARSYWQLKAPNKKDEKSLIIGTIMDTIKALANLAASEDNQAVLDWLSNNADIITAKVLQNSKP